MRTSWSGATGLTLATVSAATFGTSGTFGSALIAVGWTPGAAVTARILVAALILTPPALVQLRGRWALLRRERWPVVMYGLAAVAGAQLCYFNAVAHLSVGVALLLEYLGILLVVGWIWLRHQQRPGRLTLAGAVAAVVGLVLVLNLTGSQRLDLPGVLWGLGAAVGLAGYFVLSAREHQQLPPLVLAWAGLAVGALALLASGAARLLPLRATRTDVVLMQHQVSWLVPLVGLSVVAAVIAYLSGITAARRLGARVASFVGLTEVLFAVAFAWLLLGQIPASIQLAGGLLILVGVSLVRLDGLGPREPTPQQRPHRGPAVRALLRRRRRHACPPEDAAHPPAIKRRDPVRPDYR